LAKANTVKKKSGMVKDFVKVFLEKSTDLLLSLVENINVAEWIKDMFHLKTNIKKYAVVMVLSMSALTVLLLGVASYIASLLPELGNGVGEIFIGLILLIVALIYYKVR
jgi:hypothetical protein